MNIKFRGGLLGLKRLHGFLEVTAAQVHNGNYAKCAAGKTEKHLQSSENTSKISSDSTGESIESYDVTKKLEEELQKRDALIERSYEENENLFE
ncbi:kinesin-like protein KIN-14B [Tanacetum coccineum]